MMEKSKGRGGAFKPGADPRRNLKGRPPKGQAFADVLRRVGAEGDTLETVARRVWELAKGGDMRAIAFLADRLDGKVADRVQVAEAHTFEPDFDLLRAALSSGCGEDAAC